MDAKTLYWTAAWLNMLGVVAIATTGVRSARRVQYGAHRFRMLLASFLVLGFVASYGAKLLFLGREALETWTSSYVWILRLHEACVAAMLLGGGIALRQATRLGLPVDAQTGPAVPKEELERGVRLHRRAGLVALAAAAAGVLTAAYVLQGMYARS